MARRATAGSGHDPDPSVRRAYFECRFGQLHVHNAMPAGGGFDEATPLLCIHRSGVTGRMFAGLMRAIARDRSVYAPDLPGCGESDGPQSAAGSADLAAALGDFLADLRLRRVDVLAAGGGALVATELALARSDQVRRVAFLDLPDPAANLRIREKLPLLAQPTLLLQARDDIDFNLPAITAELRTFLSA
ncbi:MAG: alpha/beta fold hydrolase [Steroidobacteraceae bacterium]|jgi:pimeloyl-ACP methyl ester carboxylesterase